MADYQTELSQSGTTLYLKPADGFERSTKFGDSNSNTHHFSGSVYVSGALYANEYRVNEINTVSGSTKFGNSSDDTHQFTGSAYMAQDLYVVGTIFGGSPVKIGGGMSVSGTLDMSGSTSFGSDISHAHTFSGSILQTGSGGTNYFRDSNVLGSDPVLHEHKFTGSVYLNNDLYVMANKLTVTSGVWGSELAAAVDAIDIESVYGTTIVDTAGGFGSAQLSVQNLGVTAADASASISVGGATPGLITATDNTASLYVGADTSGVSLPGTIAASADRFYVSSPDAQIYNGDYKLVVSNGPAFIELSDTTASFNLGGIAQGIAKTTDGTASIFVGAVDGSGPAQGAVRIGSENPGYANVYVNSNGASALPGEIFVSGSDINVQSTDTIQLYGQTVQLMQADASGPTVMLTSGSFNLSANDASIEMFTQATPGVTISDMSSSFYMTNGGIFVGGPTYGTPNTVFEIHHTGSNEPTTLANNTGGGEVVYFGSGSTTQGALHYLNNAGGWSLTDASAVGSSGGSTGGNASLLGIALGTNPNVSGMLINGFFDADAYFTGTWIPGQAIYIYAAGAPSGKMSATAPAASSNFVRIIGYTTDTSKVIYFNPDSTWVEIA